MIPTIGRIVRYRLSAADAEQINRRRTHARDHMALHQEAAVGTQVHVGNDVREGDVFPMIITSVHGPAETSAVNGQVMLDGNDTFWATSTQPGEQVGQWSWPPRT